MIILHTAVLESRILLWGEVPAQQQVEPVKRRRGRPAKNLALPYPFDAGAGQLSEALQEAGIHFTPNDNREYGQKEHDMNVHSVNVHSAKERSAKGHGTKEHGANAHGAVMGRAMTMTAWLPTVDNQPVASSALIAEPPASTGRTTAQKAMPPVPTPWPVTVLSMSTGQAIELFCTCAGKQTLAPGVIIGHDLAFWTAAMRMAGALVARQHFLPGLTREDGVYRALWKPVLSGAENEVLTRMAKAMPAVSRALTECTVSSPPEIPAVSVLSGFISQVLDYLVRFPFSVLSSSGMSSGWGEYGGEQAGRGIKSKPGPKPGAKSKAKAFAFDSMHDQWLHALRSPLGIMEGETAELARLAAQIDEWQRQIFVLAAAPFRLCFRLEEPEAAGAMEAVPAEFEAAAATEAVAVKIEDEILPPSAVQQGNDRWYVRYLLQAAKDPSLLIPAQEVWKARNLRRLKDAVLDEAGFNFREYLLLSLGQASGLSSAIEDSLKASAPGGYELDAAGAYEFLTEKALALEQAGFGVLLPAWWTGKGTKLRLTARAQVKSPAMQASGGLSLERIVQFDWEVALGDQRLTFEELQALARLKAPLVKVRGQWVQMSAEEIQAALDLWKKKAEKEATVHEIVQMALGAGKPKGGIAFEGVTATGWIADFLAQLEDRSRLEELPSPEGFQGTLRPYQVRGYSWLNFLQHWGLGACLADDMGLGKTIQTLALIQRNWLLNGERRPVLLICPTSVVGNWQKEASRFTPDLPVMVHHGLTRARGAAFRREAAKQAIVISSYSLLHRDFEFLKSVSWAGVILDEAQNIKNPETKQARAARAISLGDQAGQDGQGDHGGQEDGQDGREKREGQAAEGKQKEKEEKQGKRGRKKGKQKDQSKASSALPYRLALTGTPVENNVGDLWSIMEFLNPGFLGQRAEFKRAFFIPIQANRDPEAMEQLRHLTGPFILRRLKTDKAIIDDLPEKMEMKVFCNLTREQASLYTAVAEDAAKELESAEGISRKGLVLSTLMKLKQVCNHPTQFLGDNSAIPGRSGKLARLAEMMEEILDVGDRALIFSQFAEMGQILKRYLQETFGREVLFLHGAVTKKQRDLMVERFQAEGDGPAIFILSLKAGGTGLNLTRANHVFHFDRWWNPAVENQATDRAFRIGQSKNVQVHKFLCVGTLEEKIDEMIESKKDIARSVVGTGEGWLTELSTAELKELFALRKEAVGE
ncbi:MAG: DEAD/DEAH box helicase [bacterium]